MVAVLDPQSQQLLQPVFRFPQYVNLQMISFHAHTHVIFVYGSEVSKYETLSKLACENIRFSSLFAAGTFREEERLRLSGKNSILMTQTNV